MNAIKRKELDRAGKLIQEAMEIVTGVMQEEEQSFNNLPEGIQNSQKGWTMENNADSMQNLVDDLEMIVDERIEEIKTSE